MKHVLWAIYVLSIVTVLYRIVMVQRKLPDPVWRVMPTLDDMPDIVCILFMMLCPAVNTVVAITALLAIYEGD